MKNYAVLIPAYQPMPELQEYVEELLAENISHIIVVDDGNSETHQDLFNQLEQIENCTVLYHEQNQGKGAALKTGFQYYIEQLYHLAGILTVDADGQHLIKDVLRVGDRIESMPDGFVLGNRVFDRKGMPVRSFIGNRITSRVFQLLFGTYISDTQTGLRGITTTELEWVSQLHGNHFDYEMNMLIAMVRRNSRIVRVDIEAFYADEHISTYDTYKDSLKIANSMAKEYLNR